MGRQRLEKDGMQYFEGMGKKLFFQIQHIVKMEILI